MKNCRVIFCDTHSPKVKGCACDFGQDYAKNCKRRKMFNRWADHNFAKWKLREECDKYYGRK